MTIFDKRKILENIGKYSPFVLELGCWPRKKIANAIGVDALDYDCVDIVGDVFSVLACIPDNSVDEIYSYHFFEHVEDIDILIDEVSRVLKTKGVIVTVVPHFSNPYFYSDYTHRTFFGLYTFSYLSVDKIFKRKVPTYKRQLSLNLVSVSLIFRSPFPFRSKLKRIIGKLVNLNNYTKEFYEENLSHILPCYEISYRLVKPMIADTADIQDD